MIAFASHLWPCHHRQSRRTLTAGAGAGSSRRTTSPRCWTVYVESRYRNHLQDPLRCILHRPVSKRRDDTPDLRQQTSGGQLHAAMEIPLEVTGEDSPLERSKRGRRVRLKLSVLVKHSECEFLNLEASTILQSAFDGLEASQPMNLLVQLASTYQPSRMDWLSRETALLRDVGESSVLRPAMFPRRVQVSVRQLIPGLDHPGGEMRECLGRRKE